MPTRERERFMAGSLCMLIVLLAGAGLRADDWPEIRGKGRQGIWTETGIMERFPRLRILLSHGGGALSWILPRMDFGWSLGLKGQMTRPPSKLARQFWYDTILYDPVSLSFLADAVGTDHIVVGSDYPFSIRQKQPGAFARRALANEAVLADNAFGFLGRIHDVKKLDQAASNSAAVHGSQARG